MMVALNADDVFLHRMPSLVVGTCGRVMVITSLRICFCGFSIFFDFVLFIATFCAVSQIQNQRFYLFTVQHM